MGGMSCQTDDPRGSVTVRQKYEGKTRETEPLGKREQMNRSRTSSL